jgi:hypothetical protein
MILHITRPHGGCLVNLLNLHSTFSCYVCNLSSPWLGSCGTDRGVWDMDNVYGTCALLNDRIFFNGWQLAYHDAHGMSWSSRLNKGGRYCVTWQPSEISGYKVGEVSGKYYICSSNIRMSSHRNEAGSIPLIGYPSYCWFRLCLLFLSPSPAVSDCETWGATIWTR